MKTVKVSPLNVSSYTYDNYLLTLFGKDPSLFLPSFLSFFLSFFLLFISFQVCLLISFISFFLLFKFQVYQVYLFFKFFSFNKKGNFGGMHNGSSNKLGNKTHVY